MAPNPTLNLSVQDNLWVATPNATHRSPFFLPRPHLRPIQETPIPRPPLFHGHQPCCAPPHSCPPPPFPPNAPSPPSPASPTLLLLLLLPPLQPSLATTGSTALVVNPLRPPASSPDSPSYMEQRKREAPGQSRSCGSAGHSAMDRLSICCCFSGTGPAFLLFLLVLLSAHTFEGGRGVAHCATFTFVNGCGYTVWPGVLSNAGSPPLSTTGFELAAGESRAFQAPTGWSGRFWGRAGCAFDTSSGRGACATGDCGSGQVECNGAGAAPPATLAEFTLGSAGGQDFYDVSLVDGYNLPVVVEASGGSGGCATTGCAADLNGRCPAELRAGEGGACRSACEAFGSPEYCCSGVYANPSTCQPSVYSQMFKSACPRAYSYAFDDATSTFTCSGADYFVTFCPSSVGSLKSSQDPAASSSTTTPPRTTTAGGEVMLDNSGWLASLATGGAATTRGRAPLLHHAALLLVVTACALLLPPSSLAF